MTSDKVSASASNEPSYRVTKCQQTTTSGYFVTHTHTEREREREMCNSISRYGYFLTTCISKQTSLCLIRQLAVTHA